jgi:hypothetical protein
VGRKAAAAPVETEVGREVVATTRGEGEGACGSCGEKSGGDTGRDRDWIGGGGNDNEGG